MGNLHEKTKFMKNGLIQSTIISHAWQLLALKKRWSVQILLTRRRAKKVRVGSLSVKKIIEKKYFCQLLTDFF